SVQVHGIPKLDARFTFWDPVDDLAARSEGGTTVRLDFTAKNVGSHQLRYSTSPITLSNWNQATPYGGPIEAERGETVSLLATGLPASRTVYFAVRSEVHGHLEYALSNSASAVTGAPQTDTVPPSPILDAHISQSGDNHLTLAFTAPGDDGATG